jgi:biotin carboxylase
LTKILLVMRKGFGIHGDHIDTLRRLGLAIHLVTEVPSALDDARFAEVIVVDRASKRAAFEAAVAHSRAQGIGFAVTFQETDIELCSAINEALGAEAVPVAAAAIARDKSKQRRFLNEHGLPAPQAVAVSSREDGLDAARAIGYPVIVKPTRAASSVQVALVRSPDDLAARLDDIARLASTGAGNYYENEAGPFALVEEFLPGEEVTLDAVVVGGRFHLGGIHNKLRMPGPFFNEDLYSLPSKNPAAESGLADIAAGICAALGLRNALFNVELRQDVNGQFKVVEFSPRISGGHIYRNVRDVFLIDLVAAHVASSVPELAPLAAHFLQRSAPRMSTCIKFVYRSGEVVQNFAGETGNSPHFGAYYPLAAPGTLIKVPPFGFDMAGLLSIKAVYREPSDIEAAEALAKRMESTLGLVVREAEAEAVDTGRLLAAAEHM